MGDRQTDREVWLLDNKCKVEMHKEGDGYMDRLAYWTTYIK
jgi:hypothetical protein